MTFLLIGSLLLLIAAIAGVKKNISGARAVLALAIAAGFAIFAINTWNYFAHPAGKYRFTDQGAAGRAIAAVVVRDIPQGGVLVIRLPPSTKFKQEISASRFEGLKAAFKDTPLQIIQAGPLIASMGCDDPSCISFPSEQFETEIVKWLGQHPEIKAIVSLLPIEPQLRGGNLPPLYGFSGGHAMPWADEIRSGRAKAMIVQRRGALPVDDANGELPPKYMLVTAANLDEALKDQTR
jgi:hypothetical protein